MFLSICVPTYNRLTDLRNCLTALLSQIDSIMVDEVEIVISDNASTDGTEEYVANLPVSPIEIRYFKNPSNVGMDKNFLSCYQHARGKFVWIFGDDDVLKPNALPLLIQLLKNNSNCGVCYMSSTWTDAINSNDLPTVTSLESERFESSSTFIKKINYWITFLTGAIVNKSLIEEKISPEENIGSLFVQLSWVIPAIHFSETNIYVHTPLLVCKSGNTGGYKMFKTFSVNFNDVMNRMIKRKVFDESSKVFINKALLNSFFPMFIGGSNNSFQDESVMLVLFKMYWSYPEFWTLLTRTKVAEAKQVIKKIV
jgi:abequosyltransferase